MRRFFLALAVTAATLFSPTASAQSDPRDEVIEAMEACRAITVAEIRLACMDAAGAMLDDLETPDPTVETPAAPVPATPVPSEPAVPTPAPPVSAASDTLEAERAQIAAEREALAKEREELALARAEAERVAEAAEAEDADDRRRRFFSFSEQPREIPVTIVKITVDRRGFHKFYTNEGEVLEQADIRQRLTPPSALPAEAVVKRATLGSKWLYFDEHPNRTLRVSLIQ